MIPVIFQFDHIEICHLPFFENFFKLKKRNIKLFAQLKRNLDQKT